MDSNSLLVIIAVPWLCASNGVLADTNTRDLAKLVSSLTKAKTELHIVSDFSTLEQRKFIADLAMVNVPSTVHEVTALGKRQEEEFSNEPCPLFGTTNNTLAKHWLTIPKDKIFIRRQLLPMQKYHNSILVWANSLHMLQAAVKILDQTVLWCSQYKDPGVYHKDNKIYFFSTLERDEALNIIFSSENMRRHPTVALVKQLQEERFGFWSYDFFHESSRSSMFRLNAVSSPKNIILPDIFSSLENFHGHTIRIAHVPYPPFNLGSTEPEESEERGITYNRYTNLWGYDVEILWALQKKLNFTYETVSDPGWQWGNIGENDGIWSGIIGYTESGFTDMAFGGFVFTYKNYPVLQPKFFLERDFLAFASPPPKLKNKIFTILMPFDLYTWLSIVCSTIFFGIVFYATIKMEEYSMREFLKGLKKGLFNLLWICLAILIQQSLPRRLLLEKRYAMRSLLAAWLLYCLVMSESFSGNLKAVLTRPDFTKPAQSVKDIVSGNFIWQKVKMDDEDGNALAGSTDPALIKLREGMRYIEYEVIPELKDVYGSNTVYLDYYMALETALNLKYMTGDGKPMVHLDPDPVFYADWNSWAFYKLTPWFEKFEGLLSRVIDSGLINQWKERTWARMRLEEGLKPIISPDESQAMKLEHFYGTFALYGVLMFGAAILFAAEMAIRKVLKKKNLAAASRSF